MKIQNVGDLMARGYTLTEMDAMLRNGTLVHLGNGRFTLKN